MKKLSRPFVPRCSLIFALLLFHGNLFADYLPPVRIFAPTELAEPLTKIAANDKAAKLIPRPEGELEKWNATTDVGWAIVITTDPKATFDTSSWGALKNRALLHKGKITYTMYLTMSALSIPADNAPEISAWAYILSPRSQEIFRSYGYEPVPK